MQSATAWVRWVGTPVVLAVALGCGDDRPPVYPVHGKVTFGGKPLPGGGSISFVPLGNQPGKTAAGAIAEDGTYRLTTHSPGDGSMAGEFRVVISQVTEKEPEPTPDGQAPKAAWSLPQADRIPAVYSDHYGSPLKAKVEAKNSNELNFDLKRP
jgi:hypothetical protein